MIEQAAGGGDQNVKPAFSALIWGPKLTPPKITAIRM